MAHFLFIFFFNLIAASQYASRADFVPYDQNYNQIYGGDHLTVLDHGLEVQLQLDNITGSGFYSKDNFGSGYFGMNIKIQDKNTTGTITSFYLTAVPVGQSQDVNHFEFDIEFFGTNGSIHTISTNVFANDMGHKEQQFNLWFDPSADFHKYEILWNQHQIVWFLDESPIRVWKNNTNLGVAFPTIPMHIEASIWHPSWMGIIDWNQGPFKAHYRNFDIYGCTYDSSKPQDCYSSDYYWNKDTYWQLSADQESQLQNTRKSYMYFDYCNDPTMKGPECSVNQ